MNSAVKVNGDLAFSKCNENFSEQDIEQNLRHYEAGLLRFHIQLQSSTRRHRLDYYNGNKTELEGMNMSMQHFIQEIIKCVNASCSSKY